MGYRIHYAVRDGMLQAAVSGNALGRSSPGYAECIARGEGAEQRAGEPESRLWDCLLSL